MTPSRYRKQGAGVTDSLCDRGHADRTDAAGGNGARRLLHPLRRFGREAGKRAARVSIRKQKFIRSDRELAGQVKALRAIIDGRNRRAASAGHSSHRIPAARVASSCNRFRAVRQNPTAKIARRHRTSESCTRGGARLRHKSGGRRDSLSSRGARRWQHGRLSLGRGAEAKAAVTGSGAACGAKLDRLRPFHARALQGDL